MARSAPEYNANPVTICVTPSARSIPAASQLGTHQNITLYSHVGIPKQTPSSKDESAEEFRELLRSIPSETLIVYSDGSLSTEKAAAYGYVIHRNGLTLTSGSGRLGPAEVFDAEVKGALDGLRAALNLPNPQRIFVCLDNLAVATCLRGMPADSSQEVFLEFQALATTHGAAGVRWIPGHTNITGNEQADALAKAATSLPEPADALPTLAHLRRIARQQSRDAFEAWWDASAPDQYKPLHLKPTTGCPPELKLPRPLLHHLLAARSRHGDFADYHVRFNHDDARLSCSCDPAATSDEAGTLTDCGSQSCNRQRLRQVRPAGEGKLVLRMGVSSRRVRPHPLPARVMRGCSQPPTTASFETSRTRHLDAALGRPADGHRARIGAPLSR
ncbi:reverse transcriptase [Purpureocillium lilacinum]|uniref:Reverse transcriptase n=1 Tax=Purpureocillium lilacinum TaxID=33203 RepID=A0A179F3Y6_PURLI|nr:reverse transcriptase [Purpureocillium lilacinum]